MQLFSHLDVKDAIWKFLRKVTHQVTTSANRRKFDPWVKAPEMFYFLPFQHYVIVFFSCRPSITTHEWHHRRFRVGRFLRPGAGALDDPWQQCRICCWFSGDPPIVLSRRHLVTRAKSRRRLIDPCPPTIIKHRRAPGFGFCSSSWKVLGVRANQWRLSYFAAGSLLPNEHLSFCLSKEFLLDATCSILSG